MTRPDRNAAIRSGGIADFIPTEKSSQFINITTRAGALAAAWPLYRLATTDKTFWPFFTGAARRGDLYDLSLNATSGSPQLTRSGILTYTNLDSSDNQYLSSSASQLNLTGAATYTGTPGVTIGCWVRFTTLTGEQGIIGNWTTNQQQVLLAKLSPVGTDLFRFSTSSSGTNSEVISTVSGPAFSASAGTWYFVCGRYTPSTEIKLYVHDGSTMRVWSAASTYSSLHSTSPITWNAGRHTASNYLDGDICLAWCSNTVVPDGLIYKMAVLSAPYVVG